MSNKPITMNKLRTIIRLYLEGVGLKPISAMCHTSRNTVKKYISSYNELPLSYDAFQRKSDSDLNALFRITESNTPTARFTDLESRLPEIVKSLSKKGMTTLKQWESYISENPSGHGLTQFRLSIQRYQLITNPSLHMLHKAGDKLFVDYTGDKLFIYPPRDTPRAVEVFVAILGL